MKTVSFIIELFALVCILTLISCGRDYTRYDACSSAGSACVVLCKTWANAQPLGTTRYAGAYYSAANKAYALFDRTGEIQALGAGSYSSASTGLPCSFSVAADGSVTEQ